MQNKMLSGQYGGNKDVFKRDKHKSVFFPHLIMEESPFLLASCFPHGETALNMSTPALATPVHPSLAG